MLNRRCLYTIYASSRICSKQHSKMPKLFFVPLPKTSDLSDPSNYRPISPLPVIPKSLERHIHKHLLQYLNNNKLIHQYQSGFRPDHSCHTALTRLCGSRMSAINCSEIVGAVFFHSLEKLLILWITILLKKLPLFQRLFITYFFFIFILQTGHNMFFFTTSQRQRDW